MFRKESTTLFSASDLVNFMGCAHATFLDLRNLDAPVAFPAEDAQTQLLQEKGFEHERAYLERLRAEGRSVVEIEGTLRRRFWRSAGGPTSRYEVEVVALRRLTRG